MSQDTKIIKTASILSFERKIDPSDALFSAGSWDHRFESKSWVSVGVFQKSVRGTISNRVKNKNQDSAKFDASIQAANLQTVDSSTLPSFADTLKTRFTLRVLGATGAPSSCNNGDYAQKLSAMIKDYVATQGFNELASRYAINLANGRFLWRNRTGAESIEIHVNWLKAGSIHKSWVFDAFTFSLRDFSIPAKSTSDIHELAQAIELGLSGETHVLLEVIAFVRAGDGQEVFPSQELILDKGSEKGSKSKTLYTVNNTAAMHSQKIGNALRTIDTWYPEEDSLGPIPVEPYGSVTTVGKAYRQPKDKCDFYSLFDTWVLKGKSPAVEQQHYVIANLIRGGVFGESEKE